jgi:hypothetical protein
MHDQLNAPASWFGRERQITQRSGSGVRLSAACHSVTRFSEGTHYLDSPGRGASDLLAAITCCERLR